jgi:hypothetical protein
MTNEQYQRAVQINERLNKLKEVKDAISSISDYRLSYIDRNEKNCPVWKMKHIGELLDKHDKLIRAEIEEEINNLKKEIELL